VYGRTVLWSKLFPVGNTRTELHGAYDADDDVNLFLYSVEVYPETGYPQSTAVNGNFLYFYN
jgi:hypothetical protein